MRTALCGLVAVVALAGTTTATAHPLLPHQTCHGLTTKQCIHLLRVQVAHDRGVLTAYKYMTYQPRAQANHTALRVIRWHRVSLRIAKRSLHRLLRQQRQAAGGGPIPWYWQMLHECEQPGSWTNGGPSSMFSGGLGIHRDVWGQYGGYRYASYAGGASPWGQIAVARNIMRRHGAKIELIDNIKALFGKRRTQ